MPDEPEFYGCTVHPAQPEGIARVEARVGGLVFPIPYGFDRADVQETLGALVFDPNYPAVGFRGLIDTRRLANGEYELSIVGVTAWGREEVFRRDTLRVAN